MLKRLVIAVLVLAVLAAMGPSGAFAQGKKPHAKSTSAAKHAESAQASGATGATSGPAANAIAICGCGKIFVPDASTPYLESGGKKYACCSEGCHKMAMSDPALAGKMADENTAKAMSQLNPPKPN